MLAFIPVVPATPSPRAEALGQRLAETIEQFRQQNPDLSGFEVRQATEIAVSRSGGAGAPPRALIALVTGLAVAGLALAIASKRGLAGFEMLTIVTLIMALAAGLAVILALKRR